MSCLLCCPTCPSDTLKQPRKSLFLAYVYEITVPGPHSLRKAFVWFKVAVHVINIQHPRNVHFSNNYFITTAIYITAEILQNGIGDKNFVQIKMYYVTSRRGGRCVLPRIAVLAN